MTREGPLLEILVRRLAETPADFLAAPRIGESGAVPVAAVVSDLLRDLGGSRLTPEQAGSFRAKDAKKDLNRLRIVLIACWLLHDDWFLKEARQRKPHELADLSLLVLTLSVEELATLNRAEKFVSDPDRREELVRLCLKDFGLRPAGESEAQAQDRLNTLSSLERQRVIRAARLAEERARAIREEMVRKAQAEAAAKVMRE